VELLGLQHPKGGDEFQQNLETAPNGILTNWFNYQDQSNEDKTTEVDR